jgi:signal transduction histidine kinase
MARRIDRVIAFFWQTEPRATVSGWALALDAAVAAGAAVAAVIEVADRKETFHIPLADGGLYTWTVTQHAATFALALAALTALPLAFRRLFPVTAFLVIVAAIVSLRHDTMPPVAFGTAVFAAYSAVAHTRHRNMAIGTVLAIAIGVTATFADTLPRFPGRFTALFAILPAMAAGLGIRELRRRLADSAARLRRATEEHEEATRRAIEAERARIAGELHDVVTHNVSVMVVQAGAARRVLATSPGQAEQALLAVESMGRTAMTELRHLLGLLCPQDGDPALRPQPGLAGVAALVGRMRTAGLSTELSISGTPRELSPGLDLAAYRVVQEGLTNVIRHAGEAVTYVRIKWGYQLEITVSDDGAGTGAGAGSGRGLIGLRERLAMYGGELEAGPRPEGGWLMRAVIPLAAELVDVPA